jgi:enoyl-CoA hydratase/carnithine racemase
MPDIALTRAETSAILLLNRPDKRNAITLAMWREIPALLAELSSDARLRALFIRGAQGCFAAGADIAEFETIYATRDHAIENHRIIQAAMQAVESFPAPTIAVIEGYCVGGGCGLALACDLRIAAADARLGITPGKLGLVYGVGDTRRLVQAVGLSQAKKLLFTGALIDAPEALRIGLVDQIAGPKNLEAEITGLLDQLQAASAHTARAVKDILALCAAGQREDDEASRAVFGDAFSGPDFQEGFRAFLEKRPPRFP